MRKIFTTYEEQIKTLKEKRLIIVDEPSLRNNLKEIGYYNLINGYGEIFYYAKDWYCRTATDKDIYNLYLFDKNLRNITYNYALRLESKIKAIVCHIFSKYNGEDHRKYIAPESFDKDISKKARIEKLLKRCWQIIQKGTEAKSNTRRRYLVHYMQSHGYVPLWVLARAMTLGDISVFYSSMKPNEKFEISSEFNVKPKHFEIMLKMLVAYRNIVAHDERIFNVKLYNDHLPDTLSIYNKLKTPRSDTGLPMHGRKDFFALIIIFKYLLTPFDFASFWHAFENEFRALQTQIKSHFIEKIKGSMGLVGAWWELKDFYMEE